MEKSAASSPGSNGYYDYSSRQMSANIILYNIHCKKSILLNALNMLELCTFHKLE